MISCVEQCFVHWFSTEVQQNFSGMGVCHKQVAYLLKFNTKNSHV